MENQISYLTYNKNLNIFNINIEKIKNIIKKAIKNKLVIIGSGGSNNIIIINKEIPFVMKIIPTLKNNLLIKQYNNDILEVDIYKKLTNEFINITPHIVYMYKNYILNDINLIFPNNCLTFDQKLIINPNKINQSNEHLCKLKKKYDKNLLDDKLNILLVEYCSTTISDYFEDIIKIKNEKIAMKLFIENIRRVIFQCMFTLAVIRDKYPDFIHNDLFLRNILAVEETNYNNNDYVKYNYNNKSYYLPANGIYIKINDYGYSLNILKENSSLVEMINNDVEDLMEIKNPFRDVYTFFYDLYDGANLGAYSLMELIYKFIKNKKQRLTFINILKNEINKFFNYKEIDKIKKINYNLNWEWNIGESKILKSTVKTPQEYFNKKLFNYYLVLPNNANIVKEFN